MSWVLLWAVRSPRSHRGTRANRVTHGYQGAELRVQPAAGRFSTASMSPCPHPMDTGRSAPAGDGEHPHLPRAPPWRP